MEIRQLRYFVRIADLGSLSRAAEALHVAQPALSQQMANLEAELGQPLLVRRSTGVRMTEQGEVFYRRARLILKELADIGTSVNRVAGTVTGTVTLGLPQSTAAMYAMPLLEAVRTAHPGVTLEFFDEISGNLLRGVTSGRLDMALLVNDEDAALLSATPLIEETLYLFSRPDLSPAGEEVSQALLAELPLALPGHGHGVRDLVEQASRSAGSTLPAPAIVANSMSIMRRALLVGMAHGVMPWCALEDDARSGTLVAKPFTPPLRRRVQLCVARDASLTIAGQVVFDLLLATIRQQVSAGHWPGTRLMAAP